MPLNLPNFGFAPQNHDMSNLSKMVENFYKGYESARTPVKLEQEELARALQNKILGIHNQYLPGQYESGIANTNAQARLHGEQARWVGPQAQSSIGLNSAHSAYYGATGAKAEEETRNLLRQREIIDQILASQGIGLGGQQQGQAQGQQQFQQNPAQNANPGAQQMPGQTAQGVQQARQGISPLAESLIAKMMGIDPLKPFLNSDNTFVQPSLFGEPTTTQVGPTERQRELTKAQIDSNKKAIEKNTEAQQKDASVNLAWDQLGELTKSYPKELKDLIGIVKGRTVTLSPRKREIEGQLDASLGKIVLDTAQDIKGAWNARDQAMVDAFKPSKTDFDYNVFLGKFKASQAIQRTLQKRRELYGQYLQQDVPEYEAARRAEAETSLEKLRPEIEKEYGQKKYFQIKDSSGNPQVIGISIFDEKALKRAAKEGKELK